MTVPVFTHIYYFWLKCTLEANVCSSPIVKPKVGISIIWLINKSDDQHLRTFYNSASIDADRERSVLRTTGELVMQTNTGMILCEIFSLGPI